jgi:hypothetical protein
MPWGGSPSSAAQKGRPLFGQTLEQGGRRRRGNFAWEDRRGLLGNSGPTYPFLSAVTSVRLNWDLSKKRMGQEEAGGMVKCGKVQGEKSAPFHQFPVWPRTEPRTK